MTAYGPDDFHASGPSVPLTERWRFDGEEFVRASGRASARPGHDVRQEERWADENERGSDAVERVRSAGYFVVIHGMKGR